MTFLSAQAQLNERLDKGEFSNIILSRLNDVISKIKLSEEEQRLLATNFRTQDSTVQSELKKCNVYKGVRNLSLIQDQLKLISARFEAKEFDDISIPISNYNYALLYRQPLCLKRKQISQLIKLNKQRNVVDKRPQSEFESLRKILTISQYNKYFEIFSSSDALKWTKFEWDKLSPIFSAKELDSVTVTSIIYNHQLRKFFKINYFSSLGEKDSIGAVRDDKLFGVRMFRQALGRRNYIKYFQWQNERAIQMTVERNWKSLTTYHLAERSDSVTYFNDNRTYELNFRLAMEDYAYDNSLSNKHLIQYWLENKPKKLKLLDSVLLENSMGLKEKF